LDIYKGCYWPHAFGFGGKKACFSEENTIAAYRFICGLALIVCSADACFEGQKDLRPL